MSKKIKNEQKKFLGETLNQYDKALDEAINQLDKKNREQNHKISSLVNSFDNEYLEKDVEGNMTTLENSKDGMVIINEIQGNTEVNYCKDGEKELILNGDIDTQGESFVTITEGVDGGLVDVSLEGNTEINLSNTKDPVLVTREFDDINCNVGKLQYTIDDVTTINDEPGKVDIDRIVGDTMVNHAVNGSEELILNAHINENGDNNITLNGVTSDGGKVDVYLEGNTMVNVCDQKDPVAITKSYTVETGNHVALQGEYDGKCRPVVNGNTLVNIIDSFGSVINAEADFSTGSYKCTANGTARHLYYKVIPKTSTTYTAIAYVNKNTINDKFSLIGLDVTENNSPITIPTGFTGLFVSKFTTKADNLDNIWETDLWKENTEGEIEIKGFMILEGDYTNKPLPGYFTGLQSSFEDKVVTQEMVDAGEELAENLGKYKVDYVISKEDGTIGQTKTFYLNSPLLEGDTIEQQGNNVVHVHRYSKVVLDGSADEAWQYNEKYFYILGFSDRLNDANSPCISAIGCTVPHSVLDAQSGYGINMSYGFRVNLPNINVQNNTLNEFITWLQQNPITVVYQLKTPQYEVISQNDTILCDSYVNGYLDVDSAVPIEKVEFNNWNKELMYLYPNTEYTVQFESDNSGILYNLNIAGVNVEYLSIVKGINKFNITTGSDLPHKVLVTNGIGFNASNIVVTEATDQDFGYFEGMKSVGECEGNKIEILSRNKNLIDTDISNWTSGKCIDIKTGKIIISPNRALYDKYIPVTPGSKLMYTGYIDNNGNLNTNGICILQYDFNKKYLGYSWGGNNSTLSAKCRYIKIWVDTVAPWNQLEKICSQAQLEEGNISTDRVPHAHNTQTLTHEPLRAVGDIKDKYVLIDGKWYIERNCGGYTFTGNENWETDASSENIQAFITDSVPNVRLSSTNILSNIYPMKKIRWSTNELGFDTGSGSNFLMIYVLKSDASTIEELRSYLSNNEVSITYELATPQYEKIDYNPFEVYADITHISTNSAIPTNITIKNHGYNMVALKENTQYTLYVNKDTTNALTYRLGDYVEINSQSKFTFTTPSTLTDKTLRIDSKGVKVNDLMLIEGTPANDSIGYFDGLKSSYECEQVIDENDVNYGKYKVDIKVVGKNLFDGETRNGYYSSGVFKANPNNLANVNPIRIKPNTSYAGSGDLPPRMTFYDKDMNFILYATNQCAISPSNACYMNIHAYGATWFQIEEGDTATEYEPYFESKQTVYLNSPLLKGDEIVWKDNKIQHYHKMKAVAFDGSDDEGWIDRWNSGFAIENHHIFHTKINGKKKIDGICNMFTNGNLLSLTDECVLFTEGGEDEIGICIKTSRLSSNDVNGFKQWLQDNPVTVVYQLAEPYYEEISDYPLKLNVIANSSLSTESTIQVTNISFNVYEETLPYLYSNTKYYITFNADVDRNNIVIDLGGNHVVFDCKVGFNKVEITTPSDTTNLLTFSGTGVNIDHVKVTQQDIDEYFEGMKSVGECEGNVIEIVLQNKNIFDGKWQNEVKGLFAYHRFGMGTYTISLKDKDLSKLQNDMAFGTCNMDGSGINWMVNGSSTIYTRERTVTDKKLIFRLPTKEGFELWQEIFDIQIEEGSTATDYIPHQSNTQQLTHEPLRAVGNVKDRYVLIDNKWYIERNCGYNNILRRYAINTNTVKGVAVDFTGRKLNSNVICDSIKLGNPSTPGTFYLNPGNIVVVFDKNDPITNKDMIAKVSQYNFISQLATPQYEPIDYNPFDTYADTTHISANSLIPTNVVVKNTGYNCILKPSTTYTIALNKPNGTISAKLGGSAKVDSTSNIFTITTPSTLNDNILRLSGSGNVKDIMILEGDKTVNTPSYFEGIESAFEQEYDTEKGKYRVTAKVVGDGKESSIIFYINEPLRGVEDSKDKAFIRDGKVIVERKCDSYTFDGSDDEEWMLASGGSWYIGSTTAFISYRHVEKVDLSHKFYCDNFILDGNFVKGDVEQIALNSGGVGKYACIRILNSKLATQDVNGFKQWLQHHPTTVVYKLAEPVYEEVDCDLSKLVLENYENSSLIFESNIPVSANVRYSGEVPVVTQAKALSSKVDNTTLDINENIIPYMCDIDYRIVELQLMNGDTQGEGIELLGIGDIEILSNENVLFNNREDKKYNYSYDMLKRDILSQRYSKEEYQYRLDRYLLANKISDEEYKELEGLLNNGE